MPKLNPERRQRTQARPRVRTVSPGSLAAGIGLQPGDLIRAINGQPVRDMLDYQFLSTEAELNLTIERPGDGVWEARVVKDPDADLGVDFGGQATFDGIYMCKNECLFCFVLQQPRGMRHTLNMMDDDFRLSFLHGNFVTLVGIEPERWQRILAQRLSPLYVSVHTTDPALRCTLMGSPYAGQIMDQLHTLADHGIQFHTQMVLCPGLNDGPVLERSIADLAGLDPAALLSISVVPVGLTRHRNGLHPLRTFSPDEAARTLDQCEAWQHRLQPERGFPVVYPSDEWYCLAGREVPPAEFYGAYDQLENGVGMIRLFREELAALAPRLPERVPVPCRATVVTGVLAGPTLERAVAALNAVDGLQVDLVVARNEFYGPTVTCAGLLLGRDLLLAVADRDVGNLLIIPGVSVREGDGRTLDNLTLADLSQRLGRPVAAVESPEALARLLVGEHLRPLRRRPALRRFAFHRGAAEPGYYCARPGPGATRTR